MKYVTTCIVAIAIGFLGCNPVSEKGKDAVLTDTSSDTETTRGNVFIEDKTLYSNSFIEGLVAMNYEQPIRLTDNYMVVGTDTLMFPNPLPLNTSKVFKADKDTKRYELTVTRTNHTNLNFKFELSDNTKKVLYAEKGEAVLGSLFFLGMESDEDNETQDAYDVFEYRSSKDNCFFSVRIEADNSTNQRAKVSFGCSDDSKPAMGLEESPVLKVK